jgi:hypothetical protein
MRCSSLIALALAVMTQHFVPWLCTVLIGSGLALFFFSTEKRFRDEPERGLALRADPVSPATVTADPNQVTLPCSAERAGHDHR